jgi:hypothetical protein
MDIPNHDDKKHASFPRATHAASLVNIIILFSFLILTLTNLFSKILSRKLILHIMNCKVNNIKIVYQTKFNYLIKTYNKIS